MDQVRTSGNNLYGSLFPQTFSELKGYKLKKLLRLGNDNIDIFRKVLKHNNHQKPIYCIRNNVLFIKNKAKKTLGYNQLSFSHSLKMLILVVKTIKNQPGNMAVGDLKTKAKAKIGPKR